MDGDVSLPPYCTDNGEIGVSTVDPIASMQAIENEELDEVAEKVQGFLKKVIDSL